MSKIKRVTPTFHGKVARPNRVKMRTDNAMKKTSRRLEISQEHMHKLKTYLLSHVSNRNLAIELLLRTGAREIELLRLTADCIDQEQGKLYIRAVKGGNPRWLPIHVNVRYKLALLREQLNSKEGRTLGELVYPNASTEQNITRMFRRDFDDVQKKALGAKYYSPHCARHTVAVKCFASGMDVIQVQSILGHANMSSTMVYLRAYGLKVSLDGLVDALRFDDNATLNYTNGDYMGVVVETIDSELGDAVNEIEEKAVELPEEFKRNEEEAGNLWDGIEDEAD